jgi:hypothetical protein
MGRSLYKRPQASASKILNRERPLTMKIVTFAAAAALAALLMGGAALADSAAPAAAPPGASPAKAAAAPRTAESIECSKEAEAKGLHGKVRKKFERDCKKAAAK